ncbi:MAG: phage tail family protein [Acidimicrobiia bacterium]|nr:phage tail family protein [Acidimicrobiia bacterium]
MPPAVDGQIELRDLKMGRGTAYLLRGFVPWGHPAVRTNDTARPQDHGAFAGPEYYEPRRISVTVLVAAETQADMEELLAELGRVWAAPPDVPADATDDLYWRLGGRTYLARGRPRGALVDMAGYGSGVMEVECRFEALDPVVYEYQWAGGVTGPSAAGGGHGFDVGFDHGFGAPAAPGLISAANEGNWPTRPFGRITAGPGGLDGPRITLVETAERLELDLHLAEGQYLDVDWQARTVMLNGTASRASALRRPPSTWWQLPAGSSTVRFDVAAGTGTLGLLWLPAWMR